MSGLFRFCDVSAGVFFVLLVGKYYLGPVTKPCNSYESFHCFLCFGRTPNVMIKLP